MKKNKIAMATVLAMAFITVGCRKAQGNIQENIQENAQESTQETAAAPLTVIDDKYRTTYEIFVYSFYDSDDDGIGDLKGVIEKLDYINDGDDTTDTDLGCNQIWLMPISPSPTYHKYDVIDYKDIDPQYGALEDFDALVKACHDRGVNVIIDMVLNHTSSEHPWFVEASEFLREHDELTLEEAAEQCPFIDYYSFSEEKRTGYEPLPETDYFYEARFWSGMPDLNLDNEAVLGEISDITGFWLDHGVDGFRLDAVTSYYTGDDDANIKFMTWLNDTVKKQSPDAYIVAEAWVNSSTYHKYYNSGIDSFFDFDYSGSEGIIAGVARGTTPASKYAESLAATEAAISSINPEAVDAPFYTNHDMARSSGYYVGSGGSDKVKLSGALNLLMGGNAFIYYGEELGMKGSGKDENKRAPMFWSSDAGFEGMCDGPKDMDHFEMKYPALEEQQEDEYSIYNYYKNAIRLRNTYPVIARGTTTPVAEISDSSIGAFLRQGDAQALQGTADSLLIIFNTDKEAKEIDLSGASLADGYRNLVFQLNTAENSAIIEGDILTLPSYGIAVFTRE
jgi:glycosidase